jgi:hypothetical protein
VDNHGGDEVEGVWLVMSGLSTHAYPHLFPLLPTPYTKPTPVLSRGFMVYQHIKALVTTTTFIYIHPVTRITFPQTFIQMKI